MSRKDSYVHVYVLEYVPRYAGAEGNEAAGPGDQQRAEHLDGTTWLVDVGVVCPGTPRLLAMGTDPTLGRAAAV